MVTYGLRRSRPQVRILAPHPFLLILLFSVLCCVEGSALEVGDFDHYAAAPETLAVSLTSVEPLASAITNGRQILFGVDFWLSNENVTKIGSETMTGRADGVQQLANELYDVALGVDSAIAQSDFVSSEWLEKIYDQLYTSSRSGDVVTKTSIADLTSDILSNLARNYNIVISEPLGGMSSDGTLPDFVTTSLSHHGLISLLANSLYFDSYLRRVYFNAGLTSLRSLLYPTDDFLLSSGLSGTLPELSVGNILGNGFLGLATLISGPDDHRSEYVWLGASGLDSSGRTSLMDMVGEGFLGLAYDLWPDRRDPTQQVLLDFISPDDGVSSQQYEHDNLAQLLAGGFSGLQNPLARLAYVYADQDDIDFKKAETPNLEAVKDDFFGDGQAAVKPSDIKDAAGFSSSIKDSFGGAGSAGDAFQAINDSESFWFFSQEVSDSLDTVNSPVLLSDDSEALFDQFSQDDDGFYSLIDLSPWDVSKYLGRD